jgi:Zn-finger nucleic acid-binding protein
VKCPNCHSSLEKGKHLDSICFRCVDCGGICIGIAPMRRLCGNQQFLNILWQTARHGYSNSGRPCPHCDRAMRTVTLPLEGVPIELDVCSRCDIIWFDPSEFERLPEAEPTPAPDDDLPQEAKELLAIKYAQMEGERIDNELSSYERNSRWGGYGGDNKFSGLFRHADCGGKYAIIAYVGIALVWIVIKAIECISDYRRLKSGGGKNKNWGEDVSYESELIEKKPEPKQTNKSHSAKSYDDDYYKMD